METKTTYQLITTRFCAGVVTNDRHVIVEAAPCYQQYLKRKLLDIMRELFWRGEFIWCEPSESEEEEPDD